MTETSMLQWYADAVFAPIDLDQRLVRLAGGNETEVYRTDDERFVVKLKCDLGGNRATALADAKHMRAAAEAYAACLGPDHSIGSDYVVARDSDGEVQVLVIQPFLRDACPLNEVGFSALSAAERANIAAQLRDIIRRSLRMYRRTGSMPDLYGRRSADGSARKRSNTWRMLLWRLWSFLVQRNLLRSHNLLLAAGAVPRVVLVDYDAVRRGIWYKRVYYMVRWALFWRDRVLILLMQAGATR